LKAQGFNATRAAFSRRPDKMSPPMDAYLPPAERFA
jgi:hypothetical protein